MKWIITGIFLLILCAEDWKYRQVSLIWILVLAATECLFLPDITLDFLLGAVAGGIFLTVSLMATDQLGVGDGLVFLILGAGFGIQHLINILLICGLSFFLYIAGMLVLGKTDVNTRHPFLPFLGIGYGVEMVICRLL